MDTESIRSATVSDVVRVVYEQVDTLRRELGVAPIRATAVRDEQNPRIRISVPVGVGGNVPTEVVLKIRREPVSFPIEVSEDYGR